MAQNGQFDRLKRFGMPLAICFPVSASLQYYQNSESLPSLSLAHYCNLLIGKGVNITIWPRKVDLRVTLNKVSSPGYFIFLFFLATKFFYGGDFRKSEFEALLIPVSVA